VSDGELSAIERSYLDRTPASAQLMQRASEYMPSGITRTLAWFAPYPIVFERGSGANVFDVDGHRYIDMFSNGLSLMHGHAYAPVDAALREALSRGTAWPGASDAQVDFAELLCDRVPGAEQVRFTNTGTEATMLAVKLARYTSGRPVVIKAWDGYHGSYDDLEVGLQGQGEDPGRVALATFGDLDSYVTALERNAGNVAAIIVITMSTTVGWMILVRLKDYICLLGHNPLEVADSPLPAIGARNASYGLHPGSRAAAGLPWQPRRG